MAQNVILLSFRLFIHSLHLYHHQPMKETQIIFLILPHVHLLDLAGPDQVMLEAKDYGAPIHVQYCSLSSPIHTSGLLPLGKIKHYRDVKLKAGDYIFIPGAATSYLLSQDFLNQKQLFSWLKRSHQSKINICSICTGAYVLAAAGLLDNRRCTTHWKHTYRLSEKFPKAHVIDNILFTEQDQIYTSAGVTTGIDLAMHIVNKLTNDNTTYKIARELVIYIRRQGSDSQQSIFLGYRNHMHSGIHKLQDWIQSNLHKRSTLENFAEIAKMSTRNLTRVFKKETGISIKEFVTGMRKTKIHQLLKNPDLTREQIAKQCGLKSERQIIRIVKN
jgi:transcriptional regulator GlxA family with amidase domain